MTSCANRRHQAEASGSPQTELHKWKATEALHSHADLSTCGLFLPLHDPLHIFGPKSTMNVLVRVENRLDEWDDGRLPIVLASKSLTFDEWVDWFLDKRSKPPMKLLRPAFGCLLSEITSDAIEQYVEPAFVIGKEN